MACATDLWFPRFDGQVLDRGDYLVIRTPANPGFMWGNFLLFREAPRSGDFDRWRRLFRAEIGEPLGVKHETFGWDGTAGEPGVLAPFLAAGFEFDRGAVLATARLAPPARMNAEVEVRPLVSDSDWQQAIANQIACRGDGFPQAEYERFKRNQFQRYRAMAEAGLGWWFGAFLQTRLVGDLGLFCNDGLARYQNVGTHPDYRRRGVAARLLFEAARYAERHAGVGRLVIVAEADSPTERLYMSLGFKRIERQCGLEKLP